MKPTIDQAQQRLTAKFGKESAEIYMEYLTKKEWQKPQGSDAHACATLSREMGLMVCVLKPVYDKHGFYRGQDLFYRSILAAVAPLAEVGVL